MTEYMAKRNPRMPPLHPGVLIAECVEAMHLPVARVAAVIGVSRARLDAIIASRAAVTLSIAARLGQAFGNGPELWSRLQAGYDAGRARGRLKDSPTDLGSGLN